MARPPVQNIRGLETDRNAVMIIINRARDNPDRSAARKAEILALSHRLLLILTEEIHGEVGAQARESAENVVVEFQKSVAKIQQRDEKARKRARGKSSPQRGARRRTG